jgi:hypothetical protein
MSHMSEGARETISDLVEHYRLCAAECVRLAQHVPVLKQKRCWTWRKAGSPWQSKRLRMPRPLSSSPDGSLSHQFAPRIFLFDTELSHHERKAVGRRSFPKRRWRIAAPGSRQSRCSPALTCSSQSQYRPAAPTMPHPTFIPQGQDASMK